jgi:hypothetical protein
MVLQNLQRKVNLIRWFEYAFSSSVMVYIIAILCGIRDGYILLTLVSLNASMNLFGAVMEQHNSSLRKIQLLESAQDPNTDEDIQLQPNWASFVYGCFAGIIPWIVMEAYFFVSLERLGDLEQLPEQAKNVLNTVKFIFPIIFVLFNLFALNMILQYKQVGPWQKYLFGERAYIVLSLLAKSILAWFIWGDTLH